MTTTTSGNRVEEIPACFGHYDNNESRCRFCGHSRDCYEKKFAVAEQQTPRRSATEIAAEILRSRGDA